MIRETHLTRLTRLPTLRAAERQAAALAARDAALSMIAAEGRTQGQGVSVWDGGEFSASLETPFGAPPPTVIPGLITRYLSGGKLVGVHVQPPSAGPELLPWRLSVWAAENGRRTKRLNIEWDDKGSPPRVKIVTFKRGAWENLLLNASEAVAKQGGT